MKTLTLSLIILAVTASVASALTCDICSRNIEAQYHVYQTQNGKVNICPSCKANAAKCTLCQLPLKSSGVKHLHGQPFCSECASKAQFCNNCGSVIKGKYFQLKDLGEIYCHGCYSGLKKCARCNRPLAGPESQQVYMTENKRICSNCWNTAPKCSGCGSIILRTSYRYKHTNEVFCFNCEHGTKKCYSCGLPSGKNGLELLDGRMICETCQQLAVLDEKEFEKIWKWTRGYLSRRGFRVKSNIDLHIVSRDELRKIIRGPNGTNEMGAFRWKGKEFSIHVLYGLPRPLLYETLAHEYAHAWQVENCPRNQDKMMVEGFAEWVASLVLREKGFLRQLRKMDERTDIYGQGYDKVNAISLSQGQQYLLDFICNNKQFP